MSVIGISGFKKAKWGLCSFRIEYLDIRTNLLGASLPPKLRELVESSNVGLPEPTKVSSGLLSLSQADRGSLGLKSGETSFGLWGRITLTGSKASYFKVFRLKDYTISGSWASLRFRVRVNCRA